MASTIQVRADDDLKTKSDALFKDLGTVTTTAIRMFLTQALAANGFPFEILKHVAGSLKLCDNPRLRQLGYRRINFLSHHYVFYLFLVSGIPYARSSA